MKRLTLRSGWVLFLLTSLHTAIQPRGHFGQVHARQTIHMKGQV